MAIAKDRQLFIHKRMKQMFDQDAERFQLQKTIDCGSMKVKVDLLDQEIKTAYIISKPVFNSDLKSSQILQEAQKVLVE